MRQFLRLLAPLAPERVWRRFMSYHMKLIHSVIFYLIPMRPKQHSQAAGKTQIFTRFVNQIEYISSVGMWPTWAQTHKIQSDIKQSRFDFISRKLLWFHFGNNVSSPFTKRRTNSERIKMKSRVQPLRGAQRGRKSKKNAKRLNFHFGSIRASTFRLEINKNHRRHVNIVLNQYSPHKFSSTSATNPKPKQSEEKIS